VELGHVEGDAHPEGGPLATDRLGFARDEPVQSPSYGLGKGGEAVESVGHGFVG